MILGLAYPLDPISGNLGLSCIFKSIFGIPCPTCGYVRAMHHACEGHWVESLQYNPGLAFLILLQLALMVIGILSIAKRRQVFFTKGMGIAVFLTIAVIWIFKVAWSPAYY
jgi:hypothetical protein